MMIIDLEIKVRTQLAANVQPEAFLNSWRLFHFALRSFLINKLCDREAMERLIETLPDSELPSEDDRTERPSPNARIIESLEEHVLRKYAAKINNAGETELLGRYTGIVTGIDLHQFLQAQVPQLWGEYNQAAKYARHHIAHGKVLGRRANMGKSYGELTSAMLQAFYALHSVFGEDEYFHHIVKGGPLPVFCKYSYDSSTGLLTISEDPDPITPEYGEGGE